MGKPIIRRWTKQRVIKEIRNLKTLSPRAVQKSVPSLYGAAVRIFGSWRRAVEAAGKKYVTSTTRKMPGSWNKASVTQRIADLPQKHSSYVRKSCTDLYSAALRLFGSWESAVEAAGFNYEEVRKGWVSSDPRGLRFTRKT